MTFSHDSCFSISWVVQQKSDHPVEWWLLVRLCDDAKTRNPRKQNGPCFQGGMHMFPSPVNDSDTRQSSVSSCIQKCTNSKCVTPDVSWAEVWKGICLHMTQEEVCDLICPPWLEAVVWWGELSGTVGGEWPWLNWGEIKEKSLLF